MATKLPRRGSEIHQCAFCPARSGLGRNRRRRARKARERVKILEERIDYFWSNVTLGVQSGDVVSRRGEEGFQRFAWLAKPYSVDRGFQWQLILMKVGDGTREMAVAGANRRVGGGDEPIPPRAHDQAHRQHQQRESCQPHVTTCIGVYGVLRLVVYQRPDLPATRRTNAHAPGGRTAAFNGFPVGAVEATAHGFGGSRRPKMAARPSSAMRL